MSIDKLVRGTKSFFLEIRTQCSSAIVDQIRSDFRSNYFSDCCYFIIEVKLSCSSGSFEDIELIESRFCWHLKSSKKMNLRHGINFHNNLQLRR